MNLPKIQQAQSAFSAAIFHGKVTSWLIKLTVGIYKNKIKFNKQYSFGLPFSENSKKTAQEKAHYMLFTMTENKQSANLQKENCKQLSPVRMFMVQLTSINVFYST